MGSWRKTHECKGFSSDIWCLFDPPPPRGTAVWARGMAQGPRTGAGDSSRAAGRGLLGGRQLGCPTVPILGTFSVWFRWPQWPSLALWDGGLGERGVNE